MFKLPPYNVILWHRVDSSLPGLHERIIKRAGRPPDEGIEMQGFRDMHWGFKSPDQAAAFAESLLEFAALDDVVLLVVTSYQDENFSRKVYKDTRPSTNRNASPQD
jgi:hypothetical protein